MPATEISDSLEEAWLLKVQELMSAQAQVRSHCAKQRNARALIK